MRISPSFPVLFARCIQAIFSAAALSMTIALLDTHKGASYPQLLGFSTGVSLSTLIAALSAIIFRNSLHPWIRNTVDGGLLSLNMAIGSMMLSVMEPDSCSADVLYASDRICVLSAHDVCYDWELQDHVIDIWTRCVLFACSAAIMLSNVLIILVIWTLTYKRTERGWRIRGWKVKKVNPYEPVRLDRLIPMVAVPDRVRLPTPKPF